MSGLGRHVRGAHRTTPSSFNPSLPGSEEQEQDPTQLDAPMDVSPARIRMRASSAVASLSAQPVNGRAPLSDWPEDGELEDLVPDNVPPLPLSQPVLETPIPFGDTIQGESRVPAFSRLAELPALTGMKGMSFRATNADHESPF
jgi:hypothetical protein